MSKRAHGTTPEVASIAAEALRHLEWLRDSGVGEVPPAPPRPPRARPAVERAPAPGAATPFPVPATTAPPSLSPIGTSTPSGQRIPPPTASYSLADRGCGSEPLLFVRRDMGECTRCKLAPGRTKLVYGVGNPKAELMFVGEGPGADEDAQGEPFVGRAGQLLTKMIEAMGFRREEVYIANVVKCRPPGNRDPEPDEIESCEPFLKAQIAAIQPRVIVALGRFAVQTLLRDGAPISRQRGRWRAYEGVRLMPTFHPAYLLRNPPEKKKAWDDLQLVMKEFGKTVPEKR